MMAKKNQECGNIPGTGITGIKVISIKKSLHGNQLLFNNLNQTKV